MSNQAYYGDAQAPSQAQYSNADYAGQRTQGGAAYEDTQPRQQQGYGRPQQFNEMSQPPQYQQQQRQQQYPPQQSQYGGGGVSGGQYGQQQQVNDHAGAGGYNEPIQKKDTMTKSTSRPRPFFLPLFLPLSPLPLPNAPHCHFPIPFFNRPKTPIANHTRTVLEKLEARFGGSRFTNPDNAAKNRAMNENIVKKLTYAMKLIVQRAPGYAMRYGSRLLK